MHPRSMGRLALWRNTTGFCGNGGGVFLYGNVKNSKSIGDHKIIVTILRSLILMLIMYLIHMYAVDQNDFVKLALLIAYIRLSYYEGYPIPNSTIKKVILWLGSINYWIFSLHLIISYLIRKWMTGVNYYIALLVFVMVTTLVASFCQIAENRIRYILRR